MEVRKRSLCDLLEMEARGSGPERLQKVVRWSAGELGMRWGVDEEIGFGGVEGELKIQLSYLLP